MKNRCCHKLLLLLLFLGILTSSAQNTDVEKDKIAQSIEAYFQLDREKIHLHFNKTMYLTNENIWFKGYVYNLQQNIPFFRTTNVFVSLYDENGTKLQSKLVYANNGNFSGKFELGDLLNSGKYYIQAHTNWMNNFKEDESAVFAVDVINTNNATIADETPNNAIVNIDFFPEGGHLIEGILNNIGLKISDCNGKPLPSAKAVLMDHSGKVLQQIPINKFGSGKFPFMADTGFYKIVISIDGKNSEKNLPLALPTGVALDVNNLTSDEVLFVKIKTNPKSIGNLQSKKLFLVIHQDIKSTVFDFNFDNGSLEKVLKLSKNALFPGVNTIRLVDEAMNQLCERSVFKHAFTPLNLNLETAKITKDSITFLGKFNLPNNCISISVLPEKSMAASYENDIFGSFLLNPYIDTRHVEGKYFFNEATKLKQHELDLLLLNQLSSKYKWESIISEPPKAEHDFDIGLTLKGNINQGLGNHGKYKVNLFSIYAGLNETTYINQKNEFYFENMVLADSTWINFTLLKENNKEVPLKLYPQVLNAKRIFKQPFSGAKKTCVLPDKKVAFDIPNFTLGSILLEDVEIEVSSAKTLKHKNALGNGNLRGFKMNEDNSYYNMDLVGFLRINGFDIPYSSVSGGLEIYSRTSSSLNGGKSRPAIYLDGVELMDFEMLRNIRMNEIDEIYVNPHAVAPSMKNNSGIIKIYRQFGISSAGYNKSNSISFQLKDGFSKIESFKNVAYNRTGNAGFTNLGVIDWIHTIITQNNGSFRFQVPNKGQKKVLLLIEGFSTDGNLISEIRTISVE